MEEAEDVTGVLVVIGTDQHAQATAVSDGTWQIYSHGPPFTPTNNIVVAGNDSELFPCLPGKVVATARVFRSGDDAHDLDDEDTDFLFVAPGEFAAAVARFPQYATWSLL